MSVKENIFPHKRRHRRAAILAPIHLTLGNQIYTGRTRDISVGGVYVFKFPSTDIDESTPVRLGLMIPQSDRYINVTGFVVRREASNPQQGLAFRFAGLTAEARAAIAAYVGTSDLLNSHSEVDN